MVSDNIKLNINNINEININSHLDNDNNDNNSHAINIHKLLDIVRKTYISIQKYKLLNIVDAHELYNCITSLQNIAIHLKNILSLIEHDKHVEERSFITALTEISKDLLSTIKSYGTTSVEDLLYLVFGDDLIVNKEFNDKYNLLKQYAHPINYTINNENITNDNHFICINMNNEYNDNNSINNNNEYKQFLIQVNCIQFIICYNKQQILINCLIDDIKLDILKNEYISIKLLRLGADEFTQADNVYSYNSDNDMTDVSVGTQYSMEANTSFSNGSVNSCIDTNNNNNDNNQQNAYIHTSMYKNYIKSITIKDLLIYYDADFHSNYLTYMTCINIIKQTRIEDIVNDFIKHDLYNKRKTLMTLLLVSEDQELQYLSYLLYDLITNDTNGNVDTIEQTLLFDSLPFKMKQLFHNAMKETIVYTKKMSNFVKQTEVR